MASLKISDEVTNQAEGKTEISPTAEETLFSPPDQDIVTPPTESEQKEMVAYDEEKEKEADAEEEEEEMPEAWPMNEETGPPPSFASGSTCFTFK